jgi:hypothetical protein
VKNWLESPFSGTCTIVKEINFISDRRHVEERSA